jgi:hypothetical protein
VVAVSFPVGIGKIIANYTCNKGLMYKIFKEHLQLNRKTKKVNLQTWLNMVKGP